MGLIGVWYMIHSRMFVITYMGVSYNDDYVNLFYHGFITSPWAGTLRHLHHEPARILFAVTKRRQANPYTGLVEEAQVMRAAVDDLSALIFGRQGLILWGAEYDCHVIPSGEHIGNLIVIAFATAKRQVIVARDILPVRMFGIIIKAHPAKHIHDIAGALYFDGFPPDIARQVETECGLELHAVSPAQASFNGLHHIGKEERTSFKEALRLGDARLLRAGKLAVPARIQTGVSAPERRTGARLVAAHGMGSEVQAKAQVAQVEALFQLGVAFGKHLTFPLRKR